MTPVHIERHRNGPRLYIVGQRVHHGASCSLLAAASLAVHKPIAAAVFICLAVHDYHDIKVWFTRESLPKGTIQ